MHPHSSSPLVVGIVLSLLVGTCTPTSDKECQDSVMGLVMCLSYVTGAAKTPTPDCCAGFKQVIRTSAKCLCLLIKDRNDLNLGVNINTSLALSLPRVCSAPANITQCPALLGLYPKSPEAQIFYEYGKNSSTINNISPMAGGPAPTVNPAGSTPLGGAPPSEKNGAAPSENNGGCSIARIGTSFYYIAIFLVYFFNFYFIPSNV